ncbi:MAG: chromate transporter [Bacteroidota bacterium]
MQAESKDGGKLAVLFQLFFVFLKIGAFTFGGGYAMLPLIRRELGERRSWLEPEELTDMLAIAQSAPGVIAINAATFTGYRIAGFGGAAAAILGATLPSLIVIMLVATFFLTIQDNPIVNHVFHGLRPTVFALIGIAAWQVGRSVFFPKAGTTPVACVRNGDKSRGDLVFQVVVAVVGLVAMLLLRLHPILLIVMAGAAGLVRGAYRRRTPADRELPPHPDGAE